MKQSNLAIENLISSGKTRVLTIMSPMLILDDNDIDSMELPDRVKPLVRYANSSFFTGRSAISEGKKINSEEYYTKAISNYQKAIDIAGLDSKAAPYLLYNIGTTFLYKNIHRGVIMPEIVPELVDASKYLDMALERKNRKFYLANQNLGVVLYKMGKYEDTILAFDEAIACAQEEDLPHQKAMGLHRTWEYRGQALVDLHRYSEAITSYTKTLEFVPNDSGVKNAIKYAQSQEKLTSI